MQSLHDGARRALLCAAAMLCSIPAVLMPLAGRSSFETQTQRERFAQRFGVEQPPPVRGGYMRLAIARDPFALPQHTPSRDVTGLRVVQGESTGIRIPGAAVRVTAIVKGADARALVEENGSVRVVRAGDVLAGSIVRVVLPSGLRLANGAFISIGNASQ